MTARSCGCSADSFATSSCAEREARSGRRPSCRRCPAPPHPPRLIPGGARARISRVVREARGAGGRTYPGESGRGAAPDRADPPPDGRIAPPSCRSVPRTTELTSPPRPVAASAGASNQNQEPGVPAATEQVGGSVFSLPWPIAPNTPFLQIPTIGGRDPGAMTQGIREIPPHVRRRTGEPRIMDASAFATRGRLF